MERAEAAYAAKKTFADGLEVKALYEAVLEADPNHVPALIRLAELAYWLGEVVEDGPALPHLEEGLTHARRAVELDDENPNADYWTGVLMGRIGEERGILQSLFMVDDIMKAVQRTLELDPDARGRPPVGKPGVPQGAGLAAEHRQPAKKRWSTRWKPCVSTRTPPTAC